MTISIRFLIFLLLMTATTTWAREIPAALKAPGMGPLLFQLQATGAQIYVCAASGASLRWMLKGPDADLVSADGKPFGHHSAGPTWEAADGSKIVGVLVAKVVSSKPNAIPWLLLSAKPGASGRFSSVRFIQRLDTDGGSEPEGNCTSNGAELRVPYTASYAFYD